MPLPSVAEDIEVGRLKTIDVEGIPPDYKLPMSTIYRSDNRPGLAGRWMIDRLKSLGAETSFASSGGEPAKPIAFRTPSAS
jgi:hypothetical protein